MVSDLTATSTYTRVAFSLGQGKYKKLIVKTAATALSADTITIASGYGSIFGIKGWDTTNRAQEQPTWVVATGVITVGGTLNTAERVYEILLS